MKQHRQMKPLCDLGLLLDKSVLQDKGFGQEESILNVYPQAVHVTLASISHDGTDEKQASLHLGNALKHHKPPISKFNMTVEKPTPSKTREGNILISEVKIQKEIEVAISSWLDEITRELKPFAIGVSQKFTRPHITVTKFKYFKVQERNEKENNWTDEQVIQEWENFSLAAVSIRAYLPWDAKKNEMEDNVEVRKSLFIIDLETKEPTSTDGKKQLEAVHKELETETDQEAVVEEELETELDKKLTIE